MRPCASLKKGMIFKSKVRRNEINPSYMVTKMYFKMPYLGMR